MRSLRLYLFGAFAAACLLAVTWPGHALLGARAEPLVFGLPNWLAWNMLWMALSFVALVLLYLTEP